jgi:hypothetical protein
MVKADTLLSASGTLTYLTIGKIELGKQSLLIQKTVVYNEADCLQMEIYY